MDKEQLQQQIDELKDSVRSLSATVEQYRRMPITEVQLPPHFHRSDKVSFHDLRDGFTILTATPTHVAVDGSCVLYTTGGAVRVAFKVNQTWRTAALT